MKVILLCFLLLITASELSFAQSKLSFVTTKHNFGSIKEDGGKVKTSFFFRNKSSFATKITSVSISCGCTSPKWPKETILSGDTGHIVITYDPLYRPGFFEKHIKVMLNNGVNIELIILGNVVPRTKSLEDRYPHVIGSLRFKEINMVGGFLYNDSISIIKNGIYNTSNSDIQININHNLPDFIKSNTRRKQIIAAKDSIHFEIVYDAAKRNDFGFVTDTISLITNDIQVHKKTITISTFINERLTNNGPNAELKLDKIRYDFGKITQDTDNKVEFTVTNIGSKTLHIRKIINSSEDISFKVDSYAIEPNQSSKIKVSFNPKKSIGSVVKTFTLVSNDPNQTYQIFTIKADILPKLKE